ncbi:hypothetical protein BASA50_003055 [Batrachochytrium salamandrivorans]|uniref:Cytochrome c oxidase assembly factor 3 n=1 Tax=Batrachochytrium salamandrivorans TaxID=1357716 RepID=A0ABQ8FKR9_9FUNG|nr:hypothetical protein BASA62_005294 [Batrachochytrium salamandrivorans]KAH6599358.1 hypothetical protein BASA50_003055 [Batrachochytrium salamandrivorans]KAH6602596.1 hypothetical protein BASA61_000929 [Batrachochytrium salamandrivorans]KAH9256213.1 hypothetical protein BASA81_005722 [Batrachochytrium salamandrivorans]KAH9268410.1 hypothetical protein BASA83_009409 [Batrachochytrium salamandrivorans]
MSHRLATIKKANVPYEQVENDIRLLGKKMTAEELRQYKLQALRPYRTRNIALSMGLFGSVAAIYIYTMYKMKPDDFNKLETIKKFAESGK